MYFCFFIRIGVADISTHGFFERENLLTKSWRLLGSTAGGAEALTLAVALRLMAVDFGATCSVFS
jgi:hypothetical protein